jgi:hypothetical protein
LILAIADGRRPLDDRSNNGEPRATAPMAKAMVASCGAVAQGNEGAKVVEQDRRR